MSTGIYVEKSLESLFDQPASYKIQVQCDAGNIPSGGISGMEYEVTYDGSARATMVFTGIVADQTVLNRILKSLFERNFVLLSVSRLDKVQSQRLCGIGGKERQHASW
jgi:hypothetical protein